MTEQTLKPCPFCDETDVELDDDDFGDVFVLCQGCHAQGPATRVGCREPEEVTDEQLYEEAAEAWNKRVEYPLPESPHE